MWSVNHGFCMWSYTKKEGNPVLTLGIEFFKNKKGKRSVKEITIGTPK